MSSVLNLIDLAAADFGAYATELKDNKGIFVLHLRLADGRNLLYTLEVLANTRGVFVKELTPLHLPAFCPQRHINQNGTFCLYWSKDPKPEITTVESATEWWQKVFKYLILQARAERKRRWPNNDEWAHGDAAVHQYNAIEAAAKLGPYFIRALENRAIVIKQHTKRHNAKSPTLQVWVHGHYSYSVWLTTGKVVNRKQRCFCGSSGLKRPARLRGCYDHADAAAKLALEMKKWEQAEESFWQAFENTSCCGTCDDCPLKK